MKFYFLACAILTFGFIAVNYAEHYGVISTARFDKMFFRRTGPKSKQGRPEWFNYMMGPGYHVPGLLFFWFAAPVTFVWLIARKWND